MHYGQTPPDPGLAGQGETQAPGAPELAPVYTLDMNEVSGLFDEADLPRSRRTLLRYCQHDKLDCTKVETMHGEQYFVSEASVQRLIAEILERERFTRPPEAVSAPVSGHAAPRQTMAGHAAHGGENIASGADGQATPDPGQTGQGPAGQDRQEHQRRADERLLNQVERENELLRTQMEVKDKQIERMNSQIDDLIERGREDKLLIQNFQRKLGMLAAPEEWGREPEPFPPSEPRHLPISTDPLDSASETDPGMV